MMTDEFRFKNEKKYWWHSSCGRIEFELKQSTVDSICHSGSNDDSVEHESNEDYLKAIFAGIDPMILREVIGEMIADITETELNDHESNLERMLWMASWDIFDEKFDGGEL
tara:strand:+ start:1376 stop:1708 length:333 start_codon:yes stop_codon:yes gene_type:complete